MAGKSPRNIKELEQALLERLENLEDYINEYKKGKLGRAKSISTDLRALLISTKNNKPLLLNLAEAHRIPLIVVRDVPPIQGLKSSLTLDEFLLELSFASTVPTHVKLNGYQFIKHYANQQGAHEDLDISDELLRAKGGEAIVSIGGLLAHDYLLISLAETVLYAASPLRQKLIKDNNIF